MTLPNIVLVPGGCLGVNEVLSGDWGTLGRTPAGVLKGCCSYVPANVDDKRFV